MIGSISTGATHRLRSSPLCNLLFRLQFSRKRHKSRKPNLSLKPSSSWRLLRAELTNGAEESGQAQVCGYLSDHSSVEEPSITGFRLLRPISVKSEHPQALGFEASAGQPYQSSFIRVFARKSSLLDSRPVSMQR